MTVQNVVEDGYVHEAMDRTHTILIMVEELLSRHKGITDMKLQEDVDEISDKLGELYQKVGTFWD